VELAAIYKQNGAAAISVLTEERFFQGSLTFLEQIASAKIGLPLLRKDFIFDSYQLYEARRAGASAVLLIAAGLDPGLLFELHDQALTLGLAPLVEVHSLSELEAILPCQPGLVGINNRDLHDFSVKLETSLRLRQHIPPQALVVAESGIHTARDVDCLAEAGIDAILVGEALVTAVDIGAKVRSLAC
jgi:indole-3-glycerol phosphate synthase